MSYFKIGTKDYSNVVCGLSVKYKHNYTSFTSGWGNTKVDYINRKREIEVEIIPIDDTQMKAILDSLDTFSVDISFLEPKTKTLVSNIACICSDYKVEYYTIQETNTQFQKFKITFTEL